MVFPRHYRAEVHWIRGPSSDSESSQITLLSLLFELSSCKRLTRAMLLVRDVTRNGIPTLFLKTCFFLFSDSRFVIRAIYLPSLFQPLPRWWTLTRDPYKIWLGDYILYANAVGFIYVTCPPSMNLVGAVLWGKAWIGNSEHPAWWGLHGGATPAGCSWLCFQSIRFPWDPPTCDDFPKLAHPSQTLYRQSSRMVQLTPSFQTFFPETHWILDHFDFTQDWILIELFCIQSFKGVTPRGRHTRPICN